MESKKEKLRYLAADIEDTLEKLTLKELADEQSIQESLARIYWNIEAFFDMLSPKKRALIFKEVRKIKKGDDKKDENEK